MGANNPQIATPTFLIRITMLLLALPVFAQQDTAVTLTIRFANGASQFRVGEVIRIELAFSASIGETYEMSTRNYDRSGRLDLEQFHVNPSGRDPLERYYGGGLVGAFIGGGLGSSRYLNSEPEIIREELNEWVAIDKPGNYTLYVTSGRITRHGDLKPEPVELRSNVLNFEVVPEDAGWQDQTLSASLGVLNNPASTPEERQAAIRVLRFLDFPGSIRELVQQLAQAGEQSRWDFVAGLIGSHYQELVLRELEEQLPASSAAITGDYLMLLAQTKFLLSHEPLPPYPEQDKGQQEIWLKRRDQRMKQFSELQDALYQQTAMLVRDKQGAARAETVRTLLLRPAREASAVSPLTGLPESEIASAFLALSPQQQVDLLQVFWERLKVPAIVGALKKVLEQPEIQNQQLRNFALQRLYELDPSEAAPLILAEIREPHVDRGMFTVSAKTLSVLPNKTLPQFDELLAIRLEGNGSSTMALDAQLIGRYATKSILPRVKALYQTAPGKWACDIEDGLVSYFLRVDPDYGVKRIGQGGSICTTESLKAVVRMKRWAEVEPAIIARLNAPNAWVARSAAETLATYGGIRAEKAMWRRERFFHQQWAGREKDFQQRPNMPRDVSDAISFQYGLVEALGKAQGWLLDNKEISELEELTVGPERDNVARWHWHSPVDLSVNILSDNRLQAVINGQYFANDVESLRFKLAQYPSGTQFALSAFGPQQEVAPIIDAINATARGHALIVERVATEE